MAFALQNEQVFQEYVDSNGGYPNWKRDLEQLNTELGEAPIINYIEAIGRAVPSIQTLQLENLQEIRGGAPRVLVLLAILLSFLPFFAAQNITNTSQIVGSYRPSLTASPSVAPYASASVSITETSTESVTETHTESETQTETETALTEASFNASFLTPENVVRSLSSRFPISVQRSFAKLYYASARMLALSNIVQSDDISRVYGLTRPNELGESVLRKTFARINLEEAQFMHSLDLKSQLLQIADNTSTLQSTAQPSTAQPSTALQLRTEVPLSSALQLYQNTQIRYYSVNNSTAMVIYGSQAAETYRALDTDGRLLRLQLQSDAQVAQEYVKTAVCSGTLGVVPQLRPFVDQLCRPPLPVAANPVAITANPVAITATVAFTPRVPQNETLGSCLLLMALEPGNAAAPECGRIVAGNLPLANALINSAAQIRLAGREVLQSTNATAAAVSTLSAPNGVSNLYGDLEFVNVSGQVSQQVSDLGARVRDYLANYWFYAKLGTLFLGAGYIWWNTYTARAIQNQGRDIREIRRMLDARGQVQNVDGIKDIWAFNTRGTLILYKDETKKWYYVGQGQGADRLTPIPARFENLIPQNLKDLVAGVPVQLPPQPLPQIMPPLQFFPPPQAQPQAQAQAQFFPPPQAQAILPQDELDQLFATAKSIELRIRNLRRVLNVPEDV